jgi:predicted alpha/beta-hydrolase family hydrolase
MIAKELKILATPEKGEVSALLVRPENSSHLLVPGHGASTNMRHANLQTIAERMAEVGIATFRYNFPYMEHGKGATPSRCALRPSARRSRRRRRPRRAYPFWLAATPSVAA